MDQEEKRMKRLFALLLTMSCLCASCAALPAEERAFAVALCVEKEAETWQVYGRIPTYQTGGGYLTVSGEGRTLAAALSSMETESPMQVTLSQLRLLILDEALARTDELAQALHALAERPDMRLHCAVALTDASAKAVAEALQPSTGARLSKAIDVLLESRIGQGTLLPAALADVLRLGERQSPVLMALTLKDKQANLAGGYALNGELRLAQKITEEEACLLSLLLGHGRELHLPFDDGMAQVREITVRTALSHDEMLASVEVSLRASASAWTMDSLASQLAERCAELLSKLSRMGSDVLGMGRKVIMHARDLPGWHALNWPERLMQLQWQVSVSVEGPA